VSNLNARFLTQARAIVTSGSENETEAVLAVAVVVSKAVT
jgi:hypothetical protein